MTESLTVLLNDVTVGTLSRLRGNRLVFDYDEGYRHSPAPTPLSVSMPIQIQAHGHQVVTPWLWNLLPDNDQVSATTQLWLTTILSSITGDTAINSQHAREERVIHNSS